MGVPGFVGLVFPKRQHQKVSLPPGVGFGPNFEKEKRKTANCPPRRPPLKKTKQKYEKNCKQKQKLDIGNEKNWKQKQIASDSTKARAGNVLEIAFVARSRQSGAEGREGILDIEQPRMYIHMAAGLLFLFPD